MALPQTHPCPFDGDDDRCHCFDDIEPVPAQLQALRAENEKLRKRIEELETKQ